jgi:hypothetical protein
MDDWIKVITIIGSMGGLMLILHRLTNKRIDDLHDLVMLLVGHLLPGYKRKRKK